MLCSLVVAVVVGGLMLWIWYPPPFSEILRARRLLLWIIAVDVTLGPLLTCVVFNKAKPRRELARDIGIIVLMQLAALAYGVHVAAQARPVWVAYEGDRFRLVQRADVNDQDISLAPEDLRGMTWAGPKPLAVRLVKPEDPEYLQSVQAAIKGYHPAFRPGRWMAYADHADDVLASARPMALLIQKRPEVSSALGAVLSDHGRAIEDLVYLPMVAGEQTDWIVVLDGVTADPIGYIHADGWLE